MHLFPQKICVLSIHKCIVHSCSVAAAEEVEGSQEYIRENWIFGFWNSVECFWKLWKFISWMLLLQKVICELNIILINLLSSDHNSNNTMKLRIPFSRIALSKMPSFLWTYPGLHLEICSVTFGNLCTDVSTKHCVIIPNNWFQWATYLGNHVMRT